ncbi:hypothetical protein K456DRAFT_51278 [Colletotrichum gloeosporioides 23]|nr:hypothetical protein K456DRAFT_51278 [Colletotrichum gloeosporioides 23]
MSFIHSALLSESILRSPAIGNSIRPAPQFLRLSRWQSHGQKSSAPEGMAQSAPWLALQSHMTQVLQRRKVVDDGGFNALAPKSPPSETNKFSARKAPNSQSVNKSAVLLDCCLLRKSFVVSSSKTVSKSYRPFVPRHYMVLELSISSSSVSGRRGSPMDSLLGCTMPILTLRVSGPSSLQTSDDRRLASTLSSSDCATLDTSPRFPRLYDVGPCMSLVAANLQL